MLKVNIATNNDAFQPDARYEVVRILRKLAENIEAAGIPDRSINLYDANGNRVGVLEVEGEG